MDKQWSLDSGWKEEKRKTAGYLFLSIQLPMYIQITGTCGHIPVPHGRQNTRMNFCVSNQTHGCMTRGKWEGGRGNWA